LAANQFNYRQLDALLLSLGFTRHHVEPKWRRYDHAASDTMIALIEKGPDEFVRITDAIAARYQRVENGLISEEELDERLSREPRKKKAATKKKPAAQKKKD
jgi:hypothetical protein